MCARGCKQYTTRFFFLSLTFNQLVFVRWAILCFSDINGMHSVHDDGAEDRRWKFRCQTVKNAKLTGCQTEPVFINEYDEELLFETDDRVFTGACAR